MVCVLVPIADPVLRSQGRGRVNLELPGLAVIGRSGFHLHSVVAVAELCQAEATKYIQRVDLLKEVLVALRAQRKDGATKEVELHCEFDYGGAASHGYKLVGRKNVMRIFSEICH